MLGNTNGGGRVTSAEANLLARYLAGHNVTLTDWRTADINGDGLLTLEDVILFARWLFGEDINS